MKKSTAVLFALALAGIARSQTLTIQGSTPFVIKTNTIVSADGLVLQPSADLPLTAPVTLTRNNNITHPSSNQSILRSYIFSSTVPDFTGRISIYYQDADLNSLSEPLLTLNIHDGSSWTDFPTGVIRNLTGNYVTTTSVAADLSELTLADELHPLPISWGPIRAARKRQSVTIDWSTDMELQVSHFTVERSTDGISWTVAGIILYAANTPGIHRYSLEDMAAPPVKLFYRIRETDKDGRTSFSPVVTVEAVKMANAVMLYPNPVTSTVKLSTTSPAVIKSVQVYDITGKLMKVDASCSNFGCTIPVSHMPVGTYHIRLVMQNGSVYNNSFIKQ